MQDLRYMDTLGSSLGNRRGQTMCLTVIGKLHPDYMMKETGDPEKQVYMLVSEPDKSSNAHTMRVYLFFSVNNNCTADPLHVQTKKVTDTCKTNRKLDAGSGCHLN